MSKSSKKGTSKTAATTEQAFDIGFEQGRSGRSISARLLQKKGRLRDAWEAGHFAGIAHAKAGIAHAKNEHLNTLKEMEISALEGLIGVEKWIAEQPEVFEIPARCYAFQRSGLSSVKVHNYHLRMDLSSARISGGGSVGGPINTMTSHFSITDPVNLMALADLLIRPFDLEHMSERLSLYRTSEPMMDEWYREAEVSLSRTLPGDYLYRVKEFLSFNFYTGSRFRGHLITILVNYETAKLLRAIILHHHGT